ncbi:MAG: AarF/UbiB family protein [Polyangiaceae bacterium]
MSDDRKLPEGRLSRLARLAAVSVRAGATALVDRDGSAAARHATEVLGNLRGLAAKVGQMASYVDGVIPESHRDAFEASMKVLRSQTPRSSSEQIRRCVEEELKAPIDRLFATWDDEPFASASIGQVHRATLDNGREVAVKVQHPGIAKAVESDLSNASILESIAGVAAGGRVDTKAIFDVIKQRMREELDYQREAEHIGYFTSFHVGDPTIRIPQVFLDRCSTRVLTTELVRGLDFDQACVAPENDRRMWCETMWRFVFKGNLLGGMFNADPHPGNYLFHENGSVTFIDYGCVQPINLHKRGCARQMHVAAIQKDDRAFYDGVTEMMGMPEGKLRVAAHEYSRKCFEPLFRRPFLITRDYAASLVDDMKDLAALTKKISVDEHFEMPPDMVFINRLQFGFYSVLARLDVAVDYARIESEFLLNNESLQKPSDSLVFVLSQRSVVSFAPQFGALSGVTKGAHHEMIRAERLTKRFGDQLAVDGLTLEVKEGEVFGLLGPNGAGKTTTVRMLAALVAPTSGRAWIAGHVTGEEDDAIRSSVGILTESPGLYSRLTARENLELFGKLHGVKDIPTQIEKYLSMLHLWDRRDDPAGTFSKGMQQKLAIARALLHEPRVIFLDEPTSALDPESAKVVRDFIERMRSERRTLLLLTHNLDEADRLCDRIGVFQQKLLRVDTPAAMRKSLYGRRVRVKLRQVSEALERLVIELPFAHDVKASSSTSGGEIALSVEDPEQTNPLLVKSLVDAGGEIQFVEEETHSLEQVYFAVMERGPKSVPFDVDPRSSRAGADALKTSENKGDLDSFARVWTIVQKEWLDLRKNKSIVASMAVLPGILIAIMLGIGVWLQRLPESEMFSGSKKFELPPELMPLGMKTGFLVLMNDQFTVYLLMIPIALPTAVAAYSIAGEKETRSLEPLLSTPIHTSELLLGKSLAAAIPPVIIGWLSFAISALGVSLTQPPVVRMMMLRPTWTLCMLLVTPLLAMLATLLGVMASSRAQDPKAAQSISAVVILPVTMLSLVILIGKVVLSPTVVLMLAGCLTLVNVVMLYFAVKLFQREMILTRWK